MEENSVDLIVTDPPYGMEIKGLGWDKNVPTSEFWRETARVLKPGAWCLSFCSPEMYHRMATKMEEGGFAIRDQLIWMVTTKMAKANRLKPAHEPIAVAQKQITEKTFKKNYDVWGTGKINIDGNRIPWEGEPPKGWTAGGHTRRNFGSKVEKSTRQENKKVDANAEGRYPSNIVGHFDVLEHQKYFYAPRVNRRERGEYNDHPTPKPVDLMSWLIRIYAPKKDSLVLDPFSGSGSTGLACVDLGHRYIGMDLDRHYCDIAERRIKDWKEKSSKSLGPFFDK